LCVDIKT